MNLRSLKKTHIALISTALGSLTLVGIALYFQIAEDMLPCPLCVIQRYAFILIAIGSLIALTRNVLLQKIGCCIGLYASLSGIGVALYQLYVIAHPDIQCGVDPIQTAVNEFLFSNWLPLIFHAEGICGTQYDPFLGLSIPQWSLTWFIIFTVVLLVVLFTKRSAKYK